jgi:ABC-type dipeptide/oligopeptide/nickel transport system permease component
MRTIVCVIGLILFIVTPFSAWFLVDQTNDPVKRLTAKNPSITRENIDIYKRIQGLDKPTIVRFFYWFKHASEGDFGLDKMEKKYVLPLVLFIIASILSGIAALFALKKPLISVFLFLSSTILCIVSGVYGLSTYVFAVIFLILTGLSYFSYKEELQNETQIA